MVANKRIYAPKENTKLLLPKISDHVCSQLPSLLPTFSDQRFTIGPTCKKMNDLSAGKTFKFSAFEPSDDELTKAARSRRIQRVRSNREKSMSDEDVEMNTPPPKKFTGSSLDLNDSSDDEMPDLSDLLAGREVKKKVKMETKKAVKQANTDLIEDVCL